MAESYPEGVLRQDEASLTLQVVEWLYRPFVYPYQGHETITVVSGDTLEANIEVGRPVVQRIYCQIVGLSSVEVLNLLTLLFRRTLLKTIGQVESIHSD